MLGRPSYPPGLSGGFVYPFGFGGDVRLRLVAGAVEAGRGDGHEGADLDVVVADGLAGEADLAEKAAALEDVELGLRHHVGLAFYVLDPAGGAFRVGAAAVASVL